MLFSHPMHYFEVPVKDLETLIVLMIHFLMIKLEIKAVKLTLGLLSNPSQTNWQ